MFPFISPHPKADKSTWFVVLFSFEESKPCALYNLQAIFVQALRKLDEIEAQLTSTDLPRNSSALAEQHAFLANAIVEASTPALREGRILLERVGGQDAGPPVQGVSRKVDELQERCVKLQDMCLARYEAGERSQAFNQFQDKFNNVSTNKKNTARLSKRYSSVKESIISKFDCLVSPHPKADKSTQSITLFSLCSFSLLHGWDRSLPLHLDSTVTWEVTCLLLGTS